mmetsp:Transcript_32364/g.103192  ORF Transcript_32364/g.103192 Transcript_32364/m.103192 type:complete len:321 (-) Transcript_32364:99-1061(-)
MRHKCVWWLVVATARAWVPQPGCHDVLVKEAPEDERETWLKEGTLMLTREDLRLGTAPRPKQNLTRGEWATVNGTKYIYLMNRKAGSKTWLSLMRFLREQGYDEKKYERTVAFTFVRHPYGRLVSGYEEITKRHPPICSKIPYCKQLADEPENDDDSSNKVAKFERFVRAVLTSDMKPLHHDALSYHVFSQAQAIARFQHVDFVGHLESMRDDFVALFGEDVVEHVAGRMSQNHDLESLLGKDVAPGRYEHFRQDQDSLLNFNNLSDDVQALIKHYYEQDFFCFNYSADNFTDLPWHHSSFSRDAELSHYQGGTFVRTIR